MKDNYKGKKTNIPYVDVPGEVEAAPDGQYPWLKGLSLLPRTAEFNIERPSIDFISERANYGSVTQTKAVTFTFDLRNAKPLSSAYIRFTANGDAVSFSNFAQMNGSLDFNAGVGELNIIFFFYDGTTAWYYIPHGTAPTGGPGGIGSPVATAFFGPTAPSYGTPGPAPGRYFAGGGGGGSWTDSYPGPGGAGGAGGGANGMGVPTTGPVVAAGTTNTGGGGGGAGSGNPDVNIGGTGGSGIVVIRYKFK